MQVVCFDYSNSKFELVRHLALALARNNTWSKSKKKARKKKTERIDKGATEVPG